MTLQEKFARLGTDNAPGQEGLQKDESLPMIGDKLEGPAVDFSHGDVNAHTPIPGSLETFVKQYAVEGTYQAYTEYRGKGTIRQYLAEKLAEYSGAPVDPDTEIILTPGTQGALFLAMGSLVSRGDKVAIVEPDYFDNRKLVEFFEGEIVPIQMHWQDVGEDVIFRVEDNGVGMSEEQCRSILHKEPGDNSGIGIKNVNGSQSGSDQ